MTVRSSKQFAAITLTKSKQMDIFAPPVAPYSDPNSIDICGYFLFDFNTTYYYYTFTIDLIEIKKRLNV